MQSPPIQPLVTILSIQLSIGFEYCDVLESSLLQGIERRNLSTLFWARHSNVIVETTLAGEVWLNKCPITLLQQLSTLKEEDGLCIRISP